MLVLAIDPSWASSGVALCTEDGPIWAGTVRLDGAKRYSKAGRELDAMSGRLRSWRNKHGDPAVVIEQPPPTYNQPKGARKHGAGAAYKMGLGLGGAVSAWAMWAAMWTGEEPSWAPVAEWRGWWGMRRLGDRARYKARAVEIVRVNGWGQFLCDGPATGKAGDIAEAILIGGWFARQQRKQTGGGKRLGKVKG